MNMTTQSKSFTIGARIGLAFNKSGRVAAAGVREVGSAFKWLGNEVVSDARKAGHSVAEFSRGVKAGVVA